MILFFPYKIKIILYQNLTHRIQIHNLLIYFKLKNKILVQKIFNHKFILFELINFIILIILI